MWRLDRLKHAFAIETPNSIDPTDRQREIVDSLCRSVVRRQLTSPALLALEMSRPLNYVTAQTLHFLTPLLSVVTGGESQTELAHFLEQRGSVDYICKRIEELERSRRTQEDECGRDTQAQHGRD